MPVRKYTDPKESDSNVNVVTRNNTSSSNNNSHEYLIHQAIDTHYKAVSDLEQNGEVEIHSSDIEKLQFLICQLENTLIPKNRRRCNVVTQIMTIKTYLISPASYRYLQGLDCLSLPYDHTLDGLYSSFGLENDFCAYLRQATSSFTPQERNVIIQMDEIHVKSEISYKGGKVYGPNLAPEDPTN